MAIGFLSAVSMWLFNRWIEKQEARDGPAAIPRRWLPRRVPSGVTSVSCLGESRLRRVELQEARPSPARSEPARREPSWPGHLSPDARELGLGRPLRPPRTGASSLSDSAATASTREDAEEALQRAATAIVLAAPSVRSPEAYLTARLPPGSALRR